MRDKIKNGLNHPLISGSFVIFLGSLFANLFNFLFNVFMSRNLSVPEYGILGSLISLITLFALLSGSMTPTIVNFAASHFAKGQLDGVRGLFLKISKLLFVSGAIIFIFFLILKDNIGNFLKINDSLLIILAGLISFFSFIEAINRSLLQAKLEFNFLTFINFFSAILKLCGGILLIFLGFGVRGAFSMFFISSFIPYFLTFLPLKFLFNSTIKPSAISINRLFSYAAPSAIAYFGLASFITLDIILVKHFFDPKSAGIYAGMSLIGRVIYFFSAPIATVMFPLLIHKNAKKESFRGTFFLSLVLVLSLSLILTIFYFVFPEFVITFFLKKEEYLVVSPILGLFAIFITVYSLVTVFANFYLSIKKTKIFIPIIVATAMQVLLIWYIHNTFLDIIIISLFISSLLLMVFLIYYFILFQRKDGTL